MRAIVKGKVMKSVKYLEMAKDRYNLKTDADLAEQLGLVRSAVSQYMRGTRVMSDETCLALAIALELNPLEILMAAGLDRAEQAGEQSLWEIIGKKPALLKKAVNDVNAAYVVERRRIELPTFALRTRRSPS